MTDFTPDNATEALTDAWASIDGKKLKFRRGKTAKSFEDEPGGYYDGYMEDTTELLKRLRKSGYNVTKMERWRANMVWNKPGKAHGL